MLLRIVVYGVIFATLADLARNENLSSLALMVGAGVAVVTETLKSFAGGGG